MKAVWLITLIDKGEIRVAGTATKALDILRREIKNESEKTKRLLTSQFLRNQNEFGIRGKYWARKIEVE